MGTVGTATLLGGTVDLDVGDDKALRVEALGFGVRFGVLKKVEEEAARLLRVATLGASVLLGLGVTANTTGEALERDDVLMGDNVLKVGLSPGKGLSLEDVCGFTGVLE